MKGSLLDRPNVKQRCLVMPHSKGYRVKTRALFTSRRDNLGLTRFLHGYKVGDRVVIDVDPRQDNGLTHRRYQRRVGVVEQVGRRSMMVGISVGGKRKKVVTRLEHVKPSKETGTDD